MSNDDSQLCEHRIVIVTYDSNFKRIDETKLPDWVNFGDYFFLDDEFYVLNRKMWEENEDILVFDKYNIQ